jgi:hypothetical protein
MTPDIPETYVIDTKNITDTKSHFPAAFVASVPGYNLEYARAILVGLQRKPIYGGTVSYTEKVKRRARGKRAKQSRKRNRA